MAPGSRWGSTDLRRTASPESLPSLVRYLGSREAGRAGHPPGPRELRGLAAARAGPRAARVARQARARSGPPHRAVAREQLDGTTSGWPRPSTGSRTGSSAPRPRSGRTSSPGVGLTRPGSRWSPTPFPRFSGPLPPPPHPWLEDGQPPVFVHTSNMTYWKRRGPAHRRLRRRPPTRDDARLLLVGEGPGRAEAAVARSGGWVSTGYVESVGWVEDPLQFAARAWAFVLPSDEEGFAQVLTEAMSVGCPVISTDAQGGGPRFVTEDGRYGLLVPRGDQDALREAMTTMLQAGRASALLRSSGLSASRLSHPRRAPRPSWTSSPGGSRWSGARG